MTGSDRVSERRMIIKAAFAEFVVLGVLPQQFLYFLDFWPMDRIAELAKMWSELREECGFKEDWDEEERVFGPWPYNYTN